MKGSDAKIGRTLPISIQGKPAYVSFDDELFWLNRKVPGKGSNTGE
jgi:hypothetical protein